MSESGERREFLSFIEQHATGVSNKLNLRHWIDTLPSKVRNRKLSVDEWNLVIPYLAQIEQVLLKPQ
jgi:hypothetical protein